MSLVTTELKVNLYRFIQEMGGNSKVRLRVSKNEEKLFSFKKSGTFPPVLGLSSLEIIKSAILTTDLNNGITTNNTNIRFNSSKEISQPDSVLFCILDTDTCTADIYFKDHPSLKVKFVLIAE